MNAEILYDRLEKLGYAPHVFDTSADATYFLQDYLKDKTVGFGGSMTIQQMELYPALSAYAKRLYWHWVSPGPDTLRNAMQADVYITSANAITENGVIVNMDGNGNRVASSVFGPGEVIYIIGQNKVVPDIQSAVERIRTVAAPRNAQRLHKSTPCAKTGQCMHCDRPDSFCCVLTMNLRCPAGVKGTVVLINQDLGY